VSLRLCLLAVLAALLALIPAAGAGAHDKSPEVVASGLDNPRGLDVGRWGKVYVTEAGRGGAGPCIPGPEGELCAGATGAVTKIWHGGQRRVLEGLPSAAGEGGNGATGPSDIALRGWGGAYLTVGLGGDPAGRAQLGELGPALGQLYKISHFGNVRALADIAGFEAEANPDGELPDSNPTSVTKRWGKLYVVDAGGNSLVKVRHSGEISTAAVFADLPGDPDPIDAVPTAVVVGPDGALYVSQLTGFPFPPGLASVFRVEPGGQPEVYATGFTNVTDLAFDRHGNLYVVEFTTNGMLSGDPTGALIKVEPDGSRHTIASEGLVNPYGVAIGRRGDIYVSNHGAEAGAGEVLRFKR
jgi:hypothetical protein